jgi:hypothetical protein
MAVLEGFVRLVYSKKEGSTYPAAMDMVSETAMVM